ncbi:hypothetical protein H0H92_008916 [Tricholoma furcatifolium]|nr:hypothetical protein H0H92_008916 [Tricholoma furcatifolium]
MASFSMGASFCGASFPDDCSHEPHVNFNIPLPATLETPRIKLTPFIPSIHGETFFSGYASAPELGRYLPFTLPTYQALLSFFEEIVQPDPGRVWFAIIDKTKDRNEDLQTCLAGVIGLLRCVPSNRAVEIGPVVILPAFQRTFVSSNAIGAVLKYLLDTPSERGVGFRRVVWTADPENQASVRAAQRMGLKPEGILRWTFCLPDGGEGQEVSKDRGSALGRHSVLFAICWDDWENGGKEHVDNKLFVFCLIDWRQK